MGVSRVYFVTEREFYSVSFKARNARYNYSVFMERKLGALQDDSRFYVKRRRVKRDRINPQYERKTYVSFLNI